MSPSRFYFQNKPSLFCFQNKPFFFTCYGVFTQKTRWWYETVEEILLGFPFRHVRKIHQGAAVTVRRDNYEYGATVIGVNKGWFGDAAQWTYDVEYSNEHTMRKRNPGRHTRHLKKFGQELRVKYADLIRFKNPSTVGHQADDSNGTHSKKTQSITHCLARLTQSQSVGCP